MKIEVIRPKKPVESIELRFKVFKNERGRLIIQIYDEQDRATCATFESVSNQVASTLLSKWVNFHLRHELLLLAGKGSSVEYMNYYAGQENTWKFREEVTYFGLHDLVNTKGVTKRVSIEDQIGMKNVVAILEALGYSVVSDYDEKLNRMISISLIKESSL